MPPLGNMGCRRILVTFCVLILMIYQAKADKEDKSEESMMDNRTTASTTNDDSDSSTSNSSTSSSSASSSEEGPPDSHEAMNNRELKPKLTVSSGGEGGQRSGRSVRGKRSYEFLVGLVRNQSRYEAMKRPSNGGEEGKRKIGDFDDANAKIDMKAAGDLMEMLVKISSHPKEWKSVHDMLAEIDNDLLKSKRILEQIQNNTAPSTNNTPLPTAKKNHITNNIGGLTKSDTLRDAPSYQPSGDIKKWPFESLTNDQITTSKYPAYPHNFAYHRVTGKPLYSHNANSKQGSKAYIAVSVIAPKTALAPNANAPVEDELDLENELRELKPWTHAQNLKNMASIRSKWVIQSDNDEG